jgi:hypothetical protein
MNQGRLPPVDPGPREWWKAGKELFANGYANDYERDIAEMTAFARVFNDKVVQHSSASCSNVMSVTHSIHGEKLTIR